LRGIFAWQKCLAPACVKSLARFLPTKGLAKCPCHIIALWVVVLPVLVEERAGSSARTAQGGSAGALRHHPKKMRRVPK